MDDPKESRADPRKRSIEIACQERVKRLAGEMKIAPLPNSRFHTEAPKIVWRHALGAAVDAAAAATTLLRASLVALVVQSQT